MYELMLYHEEGWTKESVAFLKKAASEHCRPPEIYDEMLSNPREDYTALFFFLGLGSSRDLEACVADAIKCTKGSFSEVRAPRCRERRPGEAGMEW